MGIFKPEVGDTVGFWNDEAELWELGTVLAYGADRRLYFIQPNDEDLAECLVDYTNIRPVSEQKTTGRMSALEFELDYWKNRAEVTHLQHVAANKRADDAETELAELQAQIDAFPYETGAPVGDRVAARIAEYRERAEKAEEDANQYTADVAYWLKRAEKAEVMAEREAARSAKFELAAAAAESRIEELEDQNRILKADRDQLKIERDEAWRAKSHAETGEQFAKEDLAELKRIKRKANKRFRKQAKEDLRREG